MKMKLSLYKASCSFGSNACCFVLFSPANYVSCICMFSDPLAWEKSDLGSYFWRDSYIEAIKIHKQMRRKLPKMVEKRACAFINTGKCKMHRP